jgi:hypothetical protein
MIYGVARCHDSGAPAQSLKRGAITMPNAESKSQKEVAQKLYAFVIERMKAGDDKVTISNKLVEMGMNSSDAAYLVDSVHAQALKTAEQERFTASSIMPALLGAIIAAVIGGVVWG